jgi:hypothetical protein
MFKTDNVQSLREEEEDEEVCCSAQSEPALKG